MNGKFLITSALACVAGSSVHAFAQASSTDAIERCAGFSDAAERIACLEAALREETPEVATEAPAPETTANPTESASAPAPAAPVVPAAQSPVVTVIAEPEPELGSEQVAARTATRETTSVANDRQAFSVVSTRTVPYEKLEVTLANGQVWRQIKGDTQKIRIPRKYRSSLDVEIWRGPVSGYKMRLTDLKRTIRVERLR